jgi:predicted nicotinamide N-methyase
MRLSTSPPAVVAAALALTAAGIIGSSSIFGILDNTGDELGDYLGLDEVPQIAVSAVRLLQPAYEPLKALSPSCTEALYPEFNDVNDWNDCSLLPRRVFWRPGAPPLLIRQTMTKANMWESSTGSAVWGCGIVLSRYMEALGAPFWEGKQVLELGSGTGFGAISAAKLGAASVLATDRDAKVLMLAAENARTNGVSGVVSTASLSWGKPEPGSGGPLATPYDVLIGSDLTYDREAWPVLFETIYASRRPCLLSAAERRPNELAKLQAEMTKAGLSDRVVDSPMSSGVRASAPGLSESNYGADKVKLFWVQVAADGAAAGAQPTAFVFPPGGEPR